MNNIYITVGIYSRLKIYRWDLYKLIDIQWFWWLQCFHECRKYWPYDALIRWFVHSTVRFCILVFYWFFEKVVQVFFWIFLWFGGRAPNIRQPCVTCRTHFTLLLREYRRIKWRSWASWSGLVAIHCLLAAIIASFRWLTRLVAVLETRTNRNSPSGWVATSHPLKWRLVEKYIDCIWPLVDFFLGLIF